MKKISFIASSMGRGGAERVMSILTKELCSDSWAVDIVMILHNINEYPLDERVRVLDFSYETIKNPICRKIKMLCELRKYIVQENPQIVVPFLAKIAALTEIALLGVKRTFRVITSERIDPYSVNYAKPLRWMINKAFDHADAVVFQSKRAQSYYAPRIQQKSKIIGNPVTMRIQRADVARKVIISAGRLEKQKNQKMLICAFAGIAEQFPEYKLHIYGEGSLRAELENQIGKLGLQERILLMGNTSDYQQKLAEAEMFVLSSDFEGLSNALLEAMMLGIPCISTNCAGSDEIIQNGENGLLVSVGETNLLKDAMIQLLSNGHFRESLGQNGKESVQKFKTENIISEWKAILEGN